MDEGYGDQILEVVLSFLSKTRKLIFWVSISVYLENKGRLILMMYWNRDFLITRVFRFRTNPAVLDPFLMSPCY